MEYIMEEVEEIVIPRYDGKHLVLRKVGENSYIPYLEGEFWSIPEHFEKLMESQAVG